MLRALTRSVAASLSLFLSTFFVFASMTWIADDAYAESQEIPTTALPLKNKDFPAADLIYQGRKLDPDAAADLRKSGTDLSLLNPTPLDIWQDASYTVSDEDKWNFPQAGAQLKYHSVMLENPEHWLRAQVIGPNNQMYRLVLSLNTHQALMRAALLRKLGYPVQSPKWLPKVTLSFPNKASKDNFIGEISTQAGLVNHTRWVISNDDNKNELVLQDVMLETPTITVPTSFYMGNLNATHLEDRRVLRALLIPFVLVDVPESVNMFSPEAGQISNEMVVLTHKYAKSFDETTYDDARWVLARIARLTRDDWEKIVAAGKYPPDISIAILEKTIARRNNLIKLFKLHDQIPTQNIALPYNLKRSSGSVVEGMVTQEIYNGYALRFTHGQPTSPLRGEDIGRFAKINLTNEGLKQVTSRLNEKLVAWSMDSIMQDRSEKLRKKFFEWLSSKPTGSYNQPITTWSGPIGGLSVNGGRNLVTGSYFGNQSSDFKVNLVDQMTVGARVGYVLGVDGLPRILPQIGGNLSLNRSYVHVRPIPSMAAADKKSWKDLWIPGFMKDLASALDQPVDGKTPEDNLTVMQDHMTKFLEGLEENEMFTVTDTLSVSASAQVSVPLSLLVGAAPLSYINNVVFGTTGSAVVLRRTTFTRENGKIKVYLQNIQSQSVAATFDFNYWMNIMRVNSTKKWGQAQTRAYHLEEKPNDEAAIRKTILAVKGILKENKTELLEENFHPLTLDHETEAKIKNAKFFWRRVSDIEERHRVKIRPAKDPKRDFNPADHERTLFTYRLLERTGSNYYSAFGDFLDGLVQNSGSIRPGLLDNAGGANPKDSFMGNAQWRLVSTEAEVTRGRESNPVAISEHFWSGWLLAKADLFKLIDKIDERLKSLDLDLPLVDRNVFNDMRRLELYELRTTFIVYEDGMAKLRERLLVKDGKRGTTIQRLAGWNEYSGTDKDIVLKLIVPLAGGEPRFRQLCDEYNEKQYGGHLSETAYTPPPGHIVHGRSYPCMLPWVNELLDLRRAYPTDREERVVWTSRVLSILEKHADLGELMKWIGKENLFYQIKISGFRTRDENGDTADYKSASVGTYSSKDKAGIFRDFAADYEIIMSELQANYLSEGF